MASKRQGKVARGRSAAEKAADAKDNRRVLKTTEHTGPSVSVTALTTDTGFWKVHFVS